MSIRFETLIRADTEALIRLYRDAGWWDNAWDDNHGFLEKIVNGSACFIGAFDKNLMIGMGRALSDGVSDAYIQDVAVLSSYRGRGIGKAIIQNLIRELKARGVDWIGLVGEPGTAGFYEKLGFKPMKDHIPFKLEDCTDR